MPAAVVHGRPPFPLPRTARLAVLASGRGSNLASLLEAFPPAPPVQDVDVEPARTPEGQADAPRSSPKAAARQPPVAPPARVVLVASNVPGAPALELGQAAGVETSTIPWTRQQGDRLTFERNLQRRLDAHGVDLICLAGFMRILSPSFTQRWAGRIVNVHPSLLPAFRGLHAQRQALEAGVPTSGCTIHLVDAGVDTGRILLQRPVPVRPGDDEGTLADRILEQEHLAYPEAVRRLLRGDEAVHEGDGTGDGPEGERTA